MTAGDQFAGGDGEEEDEEEEDAEEEDGVLVESEDVSGAWLASVLRWPTRAMRRSDESVVLDVLGKEAITR